MRLFFILMLCITAIACNRPFEVDEEEVVGEWEKADDQLPPINLVLSRDGEDLSARLRLSGVDLRGTASIDGNQLVLLVQDRAEPLVGEFVSRNELRLRFASPAGVYTLHKK